jgi:hypothetical protein
MSNRFNTYGEFLGEALDPSKFLTQEQIDWCNKHIRGKWSVNEKGEVTVRKNVGFKDKSFDRFPVQFAPVKGDFICVGCPKLISLEGAPAHVKGDFWCYDCPKLPSLEGAPAHVKGDFDCRYCDKLVSLKGAPSHVEGFFDCSWCPKLTSLKGAPAHVGGYFDCSRCPKLTSLEGAPTHVGGFFDCSYCPKLTSLEGAPAHVGGRFDCNRLHPKGALPASFEGIIEDYNEKKIDWKMAHKLIHSRTGRAAHSIGLI